MNTIRKRPFNIQPDTRANWPFLTMRDYMSYLDERGRMLHVDKPSDVRFEIGAVSKKLMEEMEGRRERFTAEIMRTLEDAPPAA